MTVITTDAGRVGSDWSRRYLPLIPVIIALLIALLVLPSALNLPQSNPTQTEEYAPVPPTQKTQPQQGNVSSFSLGNQATIGDTGNGTPPPPPPGHQLGLPPSLTSILQGKTPNTKDCVYDAKGVLRQTEDPLSPPCVAYFSGNNFGTTYQGVSGQEIRILVYLQGDINDVNTCSTPDEMQPGGVYYDLALPPQRQEDCYVSALRVWQQYFNQRYQTYGRFVHFYAYESGTADAPEARTADAADNFATVKPFAVISFVSTYENTYLEAMAQYGVLNFGSFTGRDNAFFNQYPGLIWGYAPSLEQQAANYSSFICQKMAGQPVDFAGAAFNGKPRKYGLIYTTDAGHPELREFKDLVVKSLAQCGIKFAATATFPTDGIAVCGACATSTYSEQNMAEFSADKITSIIWAGGIETSQSVAAAELDYDPEWVLAGDGGYSDGFGTNTFQNSGVWSHAWVITFEPYDPVLAQQVCYQAYKSVDPAAANVDAQDGGCSSYDELRQLFTGIQVAGPKLNPTSIDQGYHAIPPQTSFDPRVPACFYEVGDYTCIKDGVAEWWDPNGVPPGGTQPGCYRAGNYGQRYVTNAWPAGNVLTERQAEDPCSAFGPDFFEQA